MASSLASFKQDTEPAMARDEQALRDDVRSWPCIVSPRSGQLATAAYLSERSPEQRGRRRGSRKEGAAWRRAPTLPRQPHCLRGCSWRCTRRGSLPKVRCSTTGLSTDATRCRRPLYYIGAAVAQKQAPSAVRCPPRGTGRAHGGRSGSSTRSRRAAPRLSASGLHRPSRPVHRRHAAIKEARELEVAGLRYGALYRYLEAVLRVAVARAVTPPPAVEDLRARLHEFDLRLAAGGRDHSIARVYLESAQANLEAATGSDPAISGAIVADVLPRYFIPSTLRRHGAPRAHGHRTLVRWPYT